MSHTDKTDPFWVQLRDPGFRWPVVAHHFHHGLFGTTRGCDLDYPLPRTRRGRFHGCEYWPRWMDNDKIYGRSRWRRRWGSFQDHRARADLRRLKAKWLKETDREEIDSTENAPSPRWCWRKWYWD